MPEHARVSSPVRALLYAARSDRTGFDAVLGNAAAVRSVRVQGESLGRASVTTSLAATSLILTSLIDHA